jgi:hypothetical protein
VLVQILASQAAVTHGDGWRVIAALNRSTAYGNDGRPKGSRSAAVEPDRRPLRALRSRL